MQRPVHDGKRSLKQWPADANAGISLAGTVVIRQQSAFIEVDGARVLANVVRIVNSAREFTKFAALDGLEQANAQLGGLRNRIQSDAFAAAPVFETWDIRLHMKNLNPRVYHL